MIPKVIWQTYKDHSANGLAKEYIDSWVNLNPDYEYRFLVDEEIDAYINHNFDRHTLNVFRALPFGVMRADMWRYAAIYNEGGIYADLDTQCITPIEQWGIAEEHLVVGMENKTHFCQWCFAAQPRHPVLEQVLELIVERWQQGVDLSQPYLTHYLTGPGIWTQVIANHFDFANANAQKIYSAAANQSPIIKLLNENAFSRNWVIHHYGSQQWANQTNYVSWVKQASHWAIRYSRIPCLVSGWSMRENAGTIELEHRVNGQRVSLNHSSAYILAQCTGNTSVLELIAATAAAYHQEPSEIEDQVITTVYELEARGILTLKDMV